MMQEMLNVLEDVLQKEFGGSRIYRHIDALQEGVKAKLYQPLMSRIKCG